MNRKKIEKRKRELIHQLETERDVFVAKIYGNARAFEKETGMDIVRILILEKVYVVHGTNQGLDGPVTIDLASDYDEQ